MYLSILMDNILRFRYLDKVMPFVGKNLIKVLIGQRRSGKSYLLKQIMNTLIESKEVIYINKELREYKDIIDEDSLYSYIDSFEFNSSNKVLVIDEVQDIRGFENVLRSLQAEEGWDIYISGSNANILSTELSTFLSGRYIEIEVFPLSFSEFCEFHNLQNEDESLFKYIKFGGLPYLKNLELDEEVVFSYLRNVYDSIILKDVVQRHSLRNVHFLSSLIAFASDNLGSLVSAKKISDYLKKERLSISPSVVLNYLTYLCEVYFLLSVKRQQIGKKILEVGEKYYFNDLGIRNSISGFDMKDISKVLENVVFIDLKRRGFEVYVGYLDEYEIDFVGVKGDEKMYVQVTYMMLNEKTVDREFRSLLKIEDGYRKVVVTMDEAFVKLNNGSFNGTEVKLLRDFLNEDDYVQVKSKEDLKKFIK